MLNLMLKSKLMMNGIKNNKEDKEAKTIAAEAKKAAKEKEKLEHDLRNFKHMIWQCKV
jgi:hypothetical protein